MRPFNLNVGLQHPPVHDILRHRLEQRAPAGVCVGLIFCVTLNLKVLTATALFLPSQMLQGGPRGQYKPAGNVLGLASEHSTLLELV